MKKIIPKIYMKNCKGALEYYRKIFGGEVKNIQLADGKEMFKGLEGKIIHGELHINSTCILYFVDIFEDREFISDINLVLELESKEEVNKLYLELSKEGSVKYKLQKTYWGMYYAVVTDCYGNTWGLNFSEK